MKTESRKALARIVISVFALLQINSMGEATPEPASIQMTAMTLVTIGFMAFVLPFTFPAPDPARPSLAGPLFPLTTSWPVGILWLTVLAMIGSFFVGAKVLIQDRRVDVALVDFVLYCAFALAIRSGVLPRWPRGSLLRTEPEQTSNRDEELRGGKAQHLSQQSSFVADQTEE